MAAEPLPAVDLLARRPVWQHPAVLLLAGAIAAGGGFLALRATGPAKQAAMPEPTPTVAALPRPPAAVNKPLVKQVLIQSDPEGADIFATGRLEPIGKTPAWVGLEFVPEAPTRLMLRKAGFQDKAMAVEQKDDRPASVTLLRVVEPEAPAAPAEALPAPEKRPRREHHLRKKGDAVELER